MDLNATFIIFYRKDNVKRMQNLGCVLDFYRKNISDAKFIIIEDDRFPTFVTDSQILNTFYKDFVYTWVPNEKGWNKSRGYNIGIKLATTDRLVFNDVDAIIHPDQLIQSFEQLEECKGGLIYPYNGEFLCTDAEVKNEFARSVDYEVLNSRYPSFLPLDGRDPYRYINKVENGILFGHFNSTGGCVLSHKRSMIECNGYNPNFNGWGYEDDEIPKRFHKLGYDVLRLNGERFPCWHLDHTDESSSPKETQENYRDNKCLFEDVSNKTRGEMMNYIKTWKM